MASVLRMELSLGLFDLVPVSLETTRLEIAFHDGEHALPVGNGVPPSSRSARNSSQATSASR